MLLEILGEDPSFNFYKKSFTWRESKVRVYFPTLRRKNGILFIMDSYEESVSFLSRLIDVSWVCTPTLSRAAL